MSEVFKNCLIYVHLLNNLLIIIMNDQQTIREGKLEGEGDRRSKSN